MPDMPYKTTICQNLELLYCKAVSDSRTGEADIIRECYVMAKKMNKKLLEYKYNGAVPDNENTTEEQWLEDLDKVIGKGFQ